MKKRMEDYPYLIGNANGNLQAIRNNPRDVATSVKKGRMPTCRLYRRMVGNV